MKSVAVFYATREGQTQKIAERVAARLGKQGFSTEIRNVLDDAELDELSSYAAAILAASVHMGRHEREMVKFVRHHLAELQRLPITAFLSITLSEAGVERQDCGAEQRAEFEAGVTQVLDTFFTETGWHPRHVKAVAGALVYTKYNPVVRFVMKQIAKRAGADTDTSRNYEYTDWVALEAFLDEITTEIESASAAPIACNGPN